jgi:hypothetical protein
MLTPQNDEDTRSVWRWVFTLFGLQFIVGAVMALIVELLPFELGSTAWIGVVAAMVGAQLWGQICEKRVPGYVLSHRRTLTLGATACQTAFGAVLLLGLGILEMPLPWKLGSLAVGALLCFLVTWSGLGQGVKLAGRASASSSAKE